jgi:peroxin-3
MSLVNYLYERRRGLAKTTGVVGGVYIVSRYVSSRLEEMRNNFVEERVAHDK